MFSVDKRPRSTIKATFISCSDLLRVHGKVLVMFTVAMIVWLHYIAEVAMVFERSTFSVNVFSNPNTNRFVENIFRAALRTEKIDTSVLSYTTSYFLRMVNINVPYTYEVEYNMARLKTQGLLYVFLTLLFVPSVRKYVYSIMSGYRNPFTTSVMRFAFEILFNKPEAYMRVMSDHGSNVASLVMKLCGYLDSNETTAKATNVEEGVRDSEDDVVSVHSPLNEPTIPVDEEPCEESTCHRYSLRKRSRTVQV